MTSPSRLSSQVNITKLLSNLKECVQELTTDFTNSNIPIDDDNIVCQRFCGKLEQFLQLGFLERNSLFGRKKGYWDFFKSCLASSSCRGGVDSGVKFANNNPEVRTSAGRGRAFLRYCLAHSCLGDALQQSLMEADALAAWYLPTAPLRDPNLTQQLIALSYELAEVNFDLAAGGHDLDAGWPTFARRQFGSTALTWKPLSRSTSIASLSSSFNNSFQDPSSPPPGGMGGMESLPERRASGDVDPWWEASRPTTQDQVCQTEEGGVVEVPTEKVDQLDLNFDDEISSLITQHETEVRALHDKLAISENEYKKLESESETIKLNRDRTLEDLQQQIAEYNKIQEKLQYYEQECERFKAEVSVVGYQQRPGNTEDNDVLLARIMELETQLLKREENSNKLVQEVSDLRLQLKATRDTCEALEMKIKTEEGGQQKIKWEMSSLQSHVDTLLKENDQLRNDLTQMSHTVTESREKYSTNEMYVEKLTEQVTALKDVVSIGKQMLSIKDGEVEHLQRKVQNLEDMLDTEREKNNVLSTSFTSCPDLKREYEAQLSNFQSLKEIYTQRTELVSLENQALKETLDDKNRQLELMERRYNSLNDDYTKFKDTYKEKETTVNEMQRRICDLTEECRSLTNQLTMINNLFTELSKSDVDMEKLRALQDAMADGLTDTDNATSNLSRVWCALSELLENSSGDVPQPVEGSEGCYKSVNTPYGPRVVISVSQTFMRLKDLILEKKSLQKELGQLRNLNSHLETKLVQQENRLSLVLQELKKTWGVVNKMRSQHSQLRNSEAILRYDLQQKRKIVTELKEELEWCKETWQQARNKTTESEEQYRSLKDEFASRRRRPLLADDSTEMNSAESGYSDGRGEDDSGGSSTSDCEENTGDMTGSEPSSASKSPDILPPFGSRSGSSGAFTESTISNETALEVFNSPSESVSSSQISPPMSPKTGAIKKNFIKSTPDTTPSAAPVSTPVTAPVSTPSAAPISNPITSDTIHSADTNEVPRVDVGEILDARALRLKRLEEQCSQLFKRVVRTSNMSVAISNRLEELHEQYGDSEENSSKRRLRMSEVAQITNSEIPKPAPSDLSNTRLLPADRNKVDDIPSQSQIPVPPPMPVVLPSQRLPTNLDKIETKSLDTEISNLESVQGLSQNVKPEVKNSSFHQDYLRRRSERLKRISATEEQDTLSSLVQGSHTTEASKTEEILKATLVEEQKRCERIDRELTSMRVDLSTQTIQLEQFEQQLAKESNSKQEAETGLEAKQAECIALKLELQQLIEQEAEMKQRLEESDAESGSRLLQLQQLQGDTKQLHNAIIKLTMHKDALFKECYALKQANREASWQADHLVTACSACAVSFNLLVRKHHCRICGKIFCGACSSHWVPQSGDSSRRTRSCSECHSKYNTTESNGDASLTSSTNTADDPVLLGGVDQDEEEEDFSVISEEEVVLSQCVPYSPDPEILQYWKSCEIQSGLTLTVASLLTARESISESVWIRAGVIYAVPLLLTAADSNVNVTWEFTTEPKCIAFSILYKKDADIPTENSSILVPTTRVNSHQYPIRGRLRARKEGLYTLMFDNSYSRFTGKKVNFSLICENSSERSSSEPASPMNTASKSASVDLEFPDQELLDES